MKSGYKIHWTDNALRELELTIQFLEENWTEKELQNLARSLEETISLISQNPHIFQASKKRKDVRRAVILSLNSLYYRVAADQVEILSFFGNRQNPKKRKLK
jgi:plasmid stabilization system protein ParE